MDTLSLGMAILCAAFLLWGAYVCIFSRDRRMGGGDRRATPRSVSAGRRRTDLRVVEAQARVRIIAPQDRRAA